MYNIEFYEDRNGKSELLDFLGKLEIESARNKDARIQFKQIILLVNLLRLRGMDLPENYSKYLGNGLWELRPGCNRIFYCAVYEDGFVLLHSFRKKTQKTPKLEIAKAMAEKLDYLERKG